MVLLEICLVVGGVIFFKNRSKRKAERTAREEWYQSGRSQYNQSPPLQQGPPPQFSPYAPPEIPQSPTQKRPALYGHNSVSSPQPPVMSGPAHQHYGGGRDEAPPAYASLRPQDRALGYEGQEYQNAQQHTYGKR
ncbi:hypothetical protein H072_105 [Dactylellina haptotyla CBS 200.50]|uniref:Uncharacterized protein n=1 Tax=Dactylellina haptotyla (strain CBS 200.50) TaxID=1284197 RepID=S8ASG7_DACHA|nr:hypothetical protein H072_105 [Dactylellina haptotyla CBS 200.50]